MVTMKILNELNLSESNTIFQDGRSRFDNYLWRRSIPTQSCGRTTCYICYLLILHCPPLWSIWKSQLLPPHSLVKWLETSWGRRCCLFFSLNMLKPGGFWSDSETPLESETGNSETTASSSYFVVFRNYSVVLRSYSVVSETTPAHSATILPDSETAPSYSGSCIEGIRFQGIKSATPLRTTLIGIVTLNHCKQP